MQTLTLPLVSIVLLLLAMFALAILLERAQEKAGYWKGRAEGESHTTVRLEILLRQTTKRNQDLTDRITSMMREGFVEIPLPQDEDGDASESEGWPPLTDAEYRDATGRERGLAPEHYRDTYHRLGAVPMKGD
jgi:hypothetical protein